MKLSLKGLAIASGLVWGAALLCVGLTNLAVPTYGTSFMQAMSSVYPWYHGSRTIADIVIGTLDAFVDGVVAGLLFGWLYNAFSRA